MSTPLRLLVIEHERDTGIAFVGERLESGGAELITVGPQIGVPLPQDLTGVDGLVVLGGTMGPQDDEVHPYLPQARALIREAVQRPVPLLGICLGGQLMTVALGGEVASSPTPEVGCFDVELNPLGREDLVFGGLPAAMPVLQWHFLEMTRLPEGAVPLASSPRCVNQLYRVGDLAWATQFHLEGTPALAEDWATGNHQDVAEHGPATTGDAAEDVQVFLARMRELEPVMREHWGAVTDRWLGVVRDYAATHAR